MTMENSCVTPTRRSSSQLFLDYASNVPLYPECHEYFATKRPPFLAVWRKNHPFFRSRRRAFRRDPNANVSFASETL